MGGGGKYVDVLKKKDQIAIGWNDLGDLSWLLEEEETETGESCQHLRELYERTYDESSMAIGINCGQVWSFTYDIEEGDVVLIPTPEKEILIGEVISNYHFKENWSDGCRYAHRREMKWLKTVSRDDLPERLKSSMTAHLTVFNVDKHEVAIEEMLGIKKKGKRLRPRLVSGDELAEVVLERIGSLPPREFEVFVSHLLGVMGFETIKTEYVGDRGVDVIGVLNAEGLTSVRLKVQVRRVQGKIGIKEVQRTRGTLAVDEHGAIITTSGFTLQAQNEAESEKMKPVSLVDGGMLVDMILRNYDELDEKYKDLIQLKKKEPLALKDRFMVTTQA